MTEREIPLGKDIALDQNPDIPLREAVYLTLRKQILSGGFKPGEHLTEIRLGKLLGTSRTPIREAIRKLEKEGLVTIHRGSGATVAPISEKDMKDVLELRRDLDILSARLAAQRIGEEDKKLLRVACDSFEESIRSGDKIRIASADVEIHDIIAKASGNRKLVEILRTLADQVYRYRFEYIKDDFAYDRLVAEHKAITEAIIEGDEERAAKASSVHIDNQETTILEQIAKREV